MPASIILAVIVAVASILIAGLILFADGMASAPSASNAISPWPVLIGGGCISLMLLGSHYLHMTW